MTMTQNLPQFQQARPLTTIKPERIDIPSYHAQQLQAQSAPPPPGYGGVPSKNSKPAVEHQNEENIESLPDFQSIKGVFGWTTIDQVNIPYILRHDEQFVSVRIVEMKLLSRYPNSYPDDLGKHAPLTSYFITANEAKLLNEINLTHCGGEYGKKEFNTKDLIVLLSDFNNFFKLVKKTFPDGGNDIVEQTASASSHGWMQIKNTVTPYVKRQDGKYVPLSVMQHAAGLVKQGVTGVAITVTEKDLLNKACKSAGVNFQFSENTRLIRIDQIQVEGVHSFKELPTSDPLKHAHYMELPTNNAQPSQVKNNLPKAAYQNHPQKQTPNPYQFQQRLPINQGSSAARPPLQTQAPADINQTRMSQHMNRPPPRYPFPPNPMFDMRIPGMYGPPGRFPPFFPHTNGIPNGPPFPHGFPNVSVVNTPHMNPLAQYYMDQAKSPTATSLTRGASLQQSPVINHSLNGLDQNKRSPGASSSTPSPRSRHASGSRPTSGSRPPSTSRPPSETPLSPTNFALPPLINGQFLNQPAPSSSQIPQFPFPPGQTIPHLQGMVQGLQPSSGLRSSVPSVSDTVVTNFNTSLAHQNIQGQNVNIQSRQSQPVQNSAEPLSIKLPNCANQLANEQSGNKTGSVPVELNVSQSKPADKPSSGSAPPPLLRMANPSPTDEGTSIAPLSVTVPSLVPPLIKDQPVPKTVSAVPPASHPAVPYTECIKGAWLNNKSISCLHLDKPGRKGRFCLVEAVCKLYFNGYSVLEFLFALEKVLNVSLVICNDEEEKAFIQYYSLPVQVLKCNKMIEFDDLKKFFPQLSYMFPDKNAQDLNLALENTEGDSNVSEDNNNVSKALTNGLMSADELEASTLPVTVNQIESCQGEKRQRDSPTEQPSKQAKLDLRPNENDDDDDAVIILD